MNTTATKKTAKEFFTNCSNPELFKKVWNASKLTFSEFKKYPNDYRDPSSGSVGGMIYYSDTEKFAKNNLDEILDLIADFDDETGGNTLQRAKDSGNKLNFFAWFAYESMIIEFIDYLEQD